MKTYIVQLGFSTEFYPPLTKDQRVALHKEYLFDPLKKLASISEGQLVVVTELNLIGSAIVEASEEIIKDIRKLGFVAHLNSIKKTLS